LIQFNAASVFGELRKLEPLSPENKARWKKEIDWLLSVTDYIVEFVPTQQMSPSGICMEACILSYSHRFPAIQICI